MDALEAYLAELSANRTAGSVPETSGYGALANLLNEVGHKLKPRVRCVVNPANRGAGIPDGGLFVASQFERGQTAPLPGQLPMRGAVEVKGVAEDAASIARRVFSDDPEEQMRRYLGKYRQVLVTTYREFVLVGYDAEGKATSLETYSLASSEAEFWTLAAQPRKAATAHGERLADFLKRVMLRQAQIAAPQELAWFLASYAREARARVEEGGALPALITTRQALEQALGMTFESERGEHFFRSTLVQTLFYGLFAAWVFWAEQHLPTDTQARFRWREAAWYLHIPILSKLYGDFANPQQLGTMHLEEVLDWAGEALNRVDRASFFSTFEQQHAVPYFYEPFLEAFDPELRKQLGVWYTPPEIVKYMVARVDQVLRSELQITDGLANPRVVVLDPCCGTGAYLVEVLNRIAETLHEKGGDALIANDLKKAAMSRVFGFEILPAPFVISHLQIGLALDRFGAPLAEDGKERAGVFLTNALTGWEPPIEPKQHLLFPELEMERDAATDVKQKKPILVILGNPPYNAFAGVSPSEESGLVEPYKAGLIKDWGIKKFNLDDLYVRFFRVAERRIADVSGKGIVCFISNYSYVADPSFVVMRERLLAEFESVWIDCMNGDSRETGKLTPEGEPDPSVFSTERNREGIRLGTAIGLLARSGRTGT
ncbi:MAG: N-6 DNA methylase, partial [Thermoleophilia bacterium]